MTGSDPKLSVRELLEEAHPALVGLSHWIHANPEVGFEETLAAGWVAEWLDTAGFEVETGVAGMATAVVGRTGPGPFHVAICVEYDALPEVGHACGHNIIAAAGVGAGLALASVADELGLRVTVLGTPAEETGGGKLRLIDAGAFDGVHAAMMVHPWPSDVAAPSIIAVNQLEVSYTGREAHAAGFPQRGRNAGDALVIAQTAIGLLRQQLLPTDRVHGIVTRGGDAPNIIPAHTSALYMVRAGDRARLAELTQLVSRCFEAGALATGTEVSIVEGTAYANMVHDPDLAALYRHNAERLGRIFDDSDSAPVSTDMGDVSHIVPSIHPMIGIESAGAVNHQPAFADACATPSADQAVLDGALGMAWTVIDVVQDEVIRARLLGAVLAREADTLIQEAADLEQEADALEAAARSIGSVDPETATELALASAELDAAAQEKVADAEDRLDAAAALEDAAVADEVAGELASDADDLRYEAASMAETSDDLADEATQDLATAADLEHEAAQLEAEAEAVAATDPASAELLVATAAALEDDSSALREDAEMKAADAADLAGTATFVSAASDDLADEAQLMVGATEPHGYEWLEPPVDAAGSLEVEAATLAAGAVVYHDAADSALDEVADDAAIAVDATQEAAELEGIADSLVDEAASLATESSELSIEADGLTEQALAAADSDAAELLADSAFQYGFQAQATSAAADAALEEALEVESRARTADELAEVATEAADDAELTAIEDAAVAEAMAEEAVRTDDLAEVVQEAAEDAEPMPVWPAVAEVPAAARTEHEDWDEQFRLVSAHAAWDEEYARITTDVSDPDGDVGPSETPPATDAGSSDDGASPEDTWYSGPPDEDASTDPAFAADAEEASADADGSTSSAPDPEPVPATPFADFRWIPGGPDE